MHTRSSGIMRFESFDQHEASEFAQDCHSCFYFQYRTDVWSSQSWNKLFYNIKINQNPRLGMEIGLGKVLAKVSPNLAELHVYVWRTTVFSVWETNSSLVVLFPLLAQDCSETFSIDFSSLTLTSVWIFLENAFLLQAGIEREWKVVWEG